MELASTTWHITNDLSVVCSAVNICSSLSMCVCVCVCVCVHVCCTSIQEAQVAVIVMLTKFLERRKIKAHCYWPCDFGEQELFGDISVQLISMHSEDDCNIVMRSFRLRHNVTGETRTTMHVHYTEWYSSHSPSLPHQRRYPPSSPSLPPYPTPLPSRLFGNSVTPSRNTVWRRSRK